MEDNTENNRDLTARLFGGWDDGSHASTLESHITSECSYWCPRHYHNNPCREVSDVWTHESNLITCKQQCGQSVWKIWLEKQIWFICSVNKALVNEKHPEASLEKSLISLSAVRILYEIQSISECAVDGYYSQSGLLPSSFSHTRNLSWCFGA